MLSHEVEILTVCLCAQRPTDTIGHCVALCWWLRIAVHDSLTNENHTVV